ncbi:ABC transporter transmembrane domain-containing protein [Parvularcula mediterranea]|uniref:ABC transporter transmembrane domain-containing protein n=1 Tax=Parvularcula mediterranea TaxID=2732508 RepID=UPI001E380549|nr:ABC transporter ATP-binding protein [Parvularcula mediterranea]
MNAGSPETPSARHVIRLAADVIKPERSFVALAVIYGIGISLLSLATPIAVQVLINSVGYTGLAVPLVVLSFTLFFLLLASGLLNALRVHLMEIFARRFYARMTSEIALRALYAQNPFFLDDGRGPLFNRYFDIIIIQKAMPVLVIGGFTVILQAGVGFVLTSFYHPLFLALNLVMIVLIWAIWLIWGPSAIRTSVDLSIAKHKAAAWLEGLGASNGFFKSDDHIAFALRKTDDTTAEYVKKHRIHFRRHFSQTVSFLILYAAASAALLGLGGWLVIEGQLTLGQLVAAELVLSVAFLGVSQLGTYLVYFYDLCAAAEELSRFWDVEQEAPVGQLTPDRLDASLHFRSVIGRARNIPARFDFDIPSGVKLQAVASTHGTQRLFGNLLKRFESPEGGIITLGGDDLRDTEIHALRREVVVLDRPTLVEMTMREYLRLSSKNVSSEEMLQTLEAVGLDTALDELEDGLDTMLSSTGWPLSVSEAMRLKLAAGILSKPSVLILNQLYDTMSASLLKRAIALSTTDGGAPTTVIVFSNRRDDMDLDGYLFLQPDKQTIHRDYTAFCEALDRAEAARKPVPLASVMESA